MAWILLQPLTHSWHTQVSISTQLIGWENLRAVKRGGLLLHELISSLAGKFWGL